MNRRLFTAALFAYVALAHFGQKVLYEKASAYNTVVVTEEENGLCTLRFGKDGVAVNIDRIVKRST